MFELPSALFLIADGNEFRFARFYIVYEGVQLGRLKSPPIVFGVSDMSPLDCPNVEETRIIADANIQLVRNAAFLNRISICIPSEIARHDLLVLLLIIPLRITPNGTARFTRQLLFVLFYFSCIQTRIWFKPRLPHAK